MSWYECRQRVPVCLRIIYGYRVRCALDRWDLPTRWRVNVNRTFYFLPSTQNCSGQCNIILHSGRCYTHTHTHIYIYIYIYTRTRRTGRPSLRFDRREISAKLSRETCACEITCSFMTGIPTDGTWQRKEERTIRLPDYSNTMMYMTGEWLERRPRTRPYSLQCNVAYELFKKERKVLIFENL